MVDINVDNSWFWDFIVRVFDKYPLVIMIITSITIIIAVVLLVWWAITIISNKWKIGEISNNVRAIKEHICKD